MVRRIAGRRGSSNLGCLLSLLVFAAVLYYGVHIGEMYWRYYEFVDAMRVQARVAPSIDDGVIARRVADKAIELDLPPEAGRVQVRRSFKTGVITISARYAEEVDLPFFHHTFQFRPRVEAPL